MAVESLVTCLYALLKLAGTATTALLTTVEAPRWFWEGPPHHRGGAQVVLGYAAQPQQQHGCLAMISSRVRTLLGFILVLDCRQEYRFGSSGSMASE
jgi:hypothetical protein